MTLPLSFPQINPPLLQEQQGGDDIGQLAELLLAVQQQKRQGQQEERLAQESSLRKFASLSELTPGVLDTETGKGLLRDAGIDPTQVIQARDAGTKRRQAAIASTIKKVPPQWQEVIRALIDLEDVVELPAEIKSDIAKSLLPQGVDHQAFFRFLGGWRTGVITAGEAAEVAGFPLPPEFPSHLKIPKLSSTTSANDKRLQNLSRELSGLNTLMDNARVELDRERARIEKQVGIREAGGRRMATQDQENQAMIRFNRFTRQRYPKLAEWRTRSEKIQAEVQALIENKPIPPDDTEREPDELDRLIEEALRDSAPRPRR